MSTRDRSPRTFLSADGEAVQGEPWFWIAHYDDGSFLPQFDARDGRFHRFAEIDLGRLTRFDLQAAFAPALRVELPIRPGMRPIHFYRNQILTAGTPGERRVRLYYFGYQLTVGGRNVKTILEVHPTGVVRMVEE